MSRSDDSRSRGFGLPAAVLGTALGVASSVSASPPALELVEMPAPTRLLLSPSPMPGEIPHGRFSVGAGAVARVWLAGATDRYAHGVLGDAIEAGSLRVRMREGAEHAFDLPDDRVFEDLEPRLVDLDGDGVDEIAVVESDAARGASLAVYAVEGGAIVLRARSPFIGTAFRWLNPVGAGDFDGDGVVELALVETPHIGGILRVLRYAPPDLVPFGRLRGLSTHRIGSTELGLGAVVPGKGKDRLLLPDQSHEALVLVEWTDGELRERARVPLSARIETSLVALDDGRFAFTTADDRAWTVAVR